MPRGIFLFHWAAISVIPRDLVKTTVHELGIESLHNLDVNVSQLRLALARAFTSTLASAVETYLRLRKPLLPNKEC